MGGSVTSFGSGVGTQGVEQCAYSPATSF